MSMICIDINDCGLKAADESGRQLGARDPGIASLSYEGDWLYGEAARRNARLAPTETVVGFWDRLHLPDEPVNERLSELSSRDAALEHLKGFCNARQIRGDAVFIIPSFFNGKARETLLAIAKEAGLTNCACVDAGLAGFLANRGRLSAKTKQACYLDMTQGAVYGSVLSISEEMVSSAYAASEDSIGLAALEEAVFLKSDKVCLEQMRIRPSKKGATDQALYDQIPAALDSLKKAGAATLVINSRQAELVMSDYEEATGAFFDSMVSFVRKLTNNSGEAEHPVPVLVSPILSELPGIEDQMKRLPDVRPVYGDADHGLLQGALAWKSALGSKDPNEASATEIRLGQQEEEVVDKETETPPSAAITEAGSEGKRFSTGSEGFLKQTRTKPTHLLFQGWLLPLGKGSFKIGRNLDESMNGLSIEHELEEVSAQHCELQVSPPGEVKLTDWGDGRVWVNDSPAKAGQALQVGDYLGIGGHRLEIMLTSLPAND